MLFPILPGWIHLIPNLTMEILQKNEFQLLNLFETMQQICTNIALSSKPSHFVNFPR